MKNNILIKNILKSVKLVVKQNSKKLHEPIFKGNEKKYLNQCIDTGYVSYRGEFVKIFEHKIIKYTKSKFAIPTINGTSALHILLKTYGINSDHEVILPSISFVAVANAILYCNATPNFVDSEIFTFGIDPYKLRNYLIKTTKIKIINVSTKKLEK